MQPDFAGALLEQRAGGFHRQRRHGIWLGARRIEGARLAKPRHADFPLDLGVVGFEFLIADRPVREPGARNGAEQAPLIEVVLVKAPVIGGEVIAAAADHARVDERIAHVRAGRGLRRIIPEGLRARRRIVGDATQVSVLELIVLEVGGAEARALLEHDHAESRLREFARQDAAGCARADDDEIDRVSGFELARGQG